LYAERLHATSRAELPHILLERLAEYRRCEPVAFGEIREHVASLNRHQRAKLRGSLLKQLAVTQLRAARAHPATHGSATVEKLLALISGEALHPTSAPNSDGVAEAKRLYASFGAELCGTTRAADPLDRELWIDRLARSSVARTFVERGGGLGFAAISHLGVTSLPALAAQRRTVLALAMRDVRYLDRLRDYLDAFGVGTTLDTLEQLTEPLERPGACLGHVFPAAHLIALH